MFSQAHWPKFCLKIAEFTNFNLTLFHNLGIGHCLVFSYVLNEFFSARICKQDHRSQFPGHQRVRLGVEIPDLTVPKPKFLS